jgi:hypothetical protein
LTQRLFDKRLIARLHLTKFFQKLIYVVSVVGWIRF